jgi:pyruvate/2-oxoglutarate dehydrogenase complex dihydrolipoamide dehydrogenase (E3) component
MIGCKFLILGSGQSGLYLAKQIASQGQQVILLEQDVFGGSYLHNLEIPKYWLKQEANKFQLSLEIFRGFHKTHKALIHHRQSLRKVLQAKTMATYQYFWQEYQSLPNLQVIQGKGSFYSKNIVQVKTLNSRELITFEHVLIAVGKNTLVKPSYIDVEVEFLHQYNIFQLPTVPNSLAIIGFTPFNLEVAEIYASLGIQVAIFEQKNLHEAMPDLSEQAIDYLQRALTQKNINCYFDHQIDQVSKVQVQNQIKINLQIGDQKYIFDAVFKFVEETFQDKGLNLQEVGINYSPAGIVTDVRSRTTLQHVWAFGSCNSRITEQNKNHQLTDFCFKVKQKNPYVGLWDRAGIMNGNQGFLAADEMYLHLNLQRPISVIGITESMAKNMFFPDFATENIHKINLEGFITLLYRPSSGLLLGAVIAGEMSSYRHYLNLALTQKVHIREVLRYILTG